MSASFLVLCLVMFGHVGPRQNENRVQSAEAECAGPVYRLADVSVKPHIISKPEPGYTEEARRNHVSGRVMVEVVLCSTGKVTDIVVIKGLSHGLNEEAIKAARRIRFEPGVKDGKTVSVKIRLMYGFEIF
jgi:protein TonB